MRTVFHYRKERHYDRPPASIWPSIADTARVNEIVGSPPYAYEERPDAEGRVHRFAKARFGPVTLHWEEGFSEWRENQHLSQIRIFQNGPMRFFHVWVDLIPEGDGCRMVFSAEIECIGLPGWFAKTFGIIRREGEKRLAAIDRLIAERARGVPVPGSSEELQVEQGARKRFDTLIASLSADPASHGLAPKLAHFLLHAPVVTLRGMRPLAFAKEWGASGDHTVELFLAAARTGILAMGWDLLCPRCRGAKVRVSKLHELPTGAHCSSCNIAYGRDFTRNVELTFQPEPWLRPLPEGELCLLGQGSVPHVKFQAEVAPRSHCSFALTLAPGPYRFRTVEAGPQDDAEIGADGAIPSVTARGEEIVLGPGTPGEVVLRNDTDRPLIFVIEDRRWAEDALTGERVIAMAAFRRLAPEQLLRPGDDAGIGRVAIMFTDLQGSTRMYDELGDATAYRLVRDHFSFLSERIERHRGVIVKTVGDAVMAAFHDPADAVRAALAIQDEVAGFNAKGHAIVLKLGIHAGACIAVTTGDVLDYFGATVNVASRLEHACRGGEIIVSQAILADEAARAALAGHALTMDSAQLRGVSEPVTFVRVGGSAESGRVTAHG